MPKCDDCPGRNSPFCCWNFDRRPLKGPLAQTQTSLSEVQRLLVQIDAEYEAAEQGLQGLAYGTARHDFLTARTERVSRLHAELSKVVGSREQAMLIMVEHQAQETIASR